jgi:gliding motility-associated protein GldM
MGATNCPETPRQRMIGMMYLVLTAMLALNVSKEILNAFATVDDTLIISTETTIMNIGSEVQKLNNQLVILGEAKAGLAIEKGKQLELLSNDLCKYIEDTRIALLDFADNGAIVTKDGKFKLSTEVDKNEIDHIKKANDIESKDNYDLPTNFFFLQPNANGQKPVEELKKKIIDYREAVLNLVNPADKENFAKAIGLNVTEKYKNIDGLEISWEEHNFDHTILIACITLLNKLEGEVRNAEFLVLKNIVGSITADDFKFDNVNGVALAKSAIIFSGSPYEADIIVSAYDSKQTPEVYYKMGVDTLRAEDIGSATKLEGEAGKVTLKIPTSSPGENKYAGQIKIKKPDGTDGWYSFKNKYEVINPNATIAAEKMNVLYAGISNPLSVSASVPQERLTVAVANCTVSRTSEGWDVSVPTSQIGKEVTAIVTANIDGASKEMSKKNFRVKKVPDPKPVIGQNIKGGRQSKADITANALLRADMGEDFVYNLKWDVISYTAYVSVRGVETPFQCTGPRFSQELVNEIQRASKGTAIFFDNIKVKSVAGERNLDGFSVRIK